MVLDISKCSTVKYSGCIFSSLFQVMPCFTIMEKRFQRTIKTMMEIFQLAAQRNLKVHGGMTTVIGPISMVYILKEIILRMRMA